ncbi:hypothetical protein [Blastomonas sp.]|uniref:hypothetical protein n=1 Tax=Blastomonas sp. TaxID=1909299 RepID=UPI0035941853
MLTAASQMRALRLAPVVLMTVLAAACATPEMRVRDSLVRVGLSPPVAGCMAERMVGRLTLDQLQRLGNLQKLPRADDFDALLQATRGLRDPEILGVVTSSGVICRVRN